jgi:putative oxidoreductase
MRSGNSSLSMALLLLRAAAGGVLLAHGLQKLLVVTPGAFVAGLAQQGLPVPALVGWLLIAGEVGLGTLLVVGLAAKPAAGLAAVMMGLVYLTQHLLPAGFLADGAGGLEGEPALLVLAISLALFATGPGRFALDGSRVTAGSGGA